MKFFYPRLPTERIRKWQLISTDNEDAAKPLIESFYARNEDLTKFVINRKIRYIKKETTCVV